MKVISLHWFAAQQQTSTFKRQKLGLFHQNLVQNLMNLVLMSKGKRRCQTMPKTKIVRKTHVCVLHMRLRVFAPPYNIRKSVFLFSGDKEMENWSEMG